jgi:hypothetical protein
MPAICFYRYCRSILVYISHTLATYQFTKAPSILFVNPGREPTAAEKEKEKSLGAMIKLPVELQKSLMVAGKRYAPHLRKVYDNALAAQHKDTLERQKLAGLKACQDKEAEYIEGLDYLQRFKSDRCWTTKERAPEV